MYTDLTQQILQEFVDAAGLPVLEFDFFKSARVFIFREDDATQNVWSYWRGGDHRRAKRVLQYNNRTPEKVEHERKLAKVRRQALTPEQRRAARKPKPNTPEQRAKNVKYSLAHRARKRALTTQTS